MAADVTKTSICNLALSAIKQRSITDITEASEPARQCATQYDVARRDALRQCDWNFTTAAKVLVLLGDQSTAETYPDDQTKQDVFPQWFYLYAEPEPCIRVRKLLNPKHQIIPNPFRDEASSSDSERLGKPVEFQVVRSPVTNVRALATNLDNASAIITADITDESQFDDMFVSAFSLQLALAIVMPLTADQELAVGVEKKWKALMDEAKRKNGGEGTEFSPSYSEYENVRGR